MEKRIRVGVLSGERSCISCCRSPRSAFDKSHDKALNPMSRYSESSWSPFEASVASSLSS